MSKPFFFSVTKLYTFLTSFILILLITPQQLLSITNDIQNTTKKIHQQNSWNLEADILRSQGNNTIIEAEGNVVLTKDSDVFKADFARYYQETNWIFLKGNVFIRIDQDSMNADEAEFNLINKTGWILDGKVFMPVPHIYFSSSCIIKDVNNQYSITNAKMTTCDGPKPAWSISAEKAIVKLDGYTQLYHSTFNVKDISLLYTPIATFPTKQTRQSGFLVPNYGISKRRGLYYTQPYFWNINESSDVTIYGGFMTKIGPLASVRYRSHPITQQKTWLAATGIHSKNVITKPGSNPVYPSSKLLRTNKERYWIRGMSDGIIGSSTWRYVSNFDYVSDQDYLREFDQGLVSFSRSRSEMFQMFGRDINEDDRNRLSAILIRNDWERIGFAASSYYQQNTRLGHGNMLHSQNELTQRTPQADLFFYQSKILPYMPFEGKVHLQSTYMYRTKGTQGWRNEIYPKVTLPIDLIYGSAQASIGVRGTYYLTSVTSDTTPFSSNYMPKQNRTQRTNNKKSPKQNRTHHTDNKKSPKQSGTHRTLADLHLEFYSQANKVWYLQNNKPILPIPENVGKNFCTALRHNIQPRVKYQYIPKVNQEKNPFYILDDRIPPKNEIVFSISNIFTKKNVKVSMSGNQEDAVPILATSYKNIARWEISSGYNFEEASRKEYLQNFPKRPFMDIMSEFEFRVLSWLKYNGKTYVSPYNGNITRHDHTIKYSYKHMFFWQTGLSFRTKDYEYQKKLWYQKKNFLPQKLKLLKNAFSIQPTPNWLFTLEEFRNLKQGGKFGTINSQAIEITYLGQCYNIIGKYRYDGYDKSFTIMFELPGIFD